MKIANRRIGLIEPPYVVAEISGNHSGSLEFAKRLVKAAKRAGAHAVKTQCYEPDTITLNIAKPDFIVQDGLWRGRTLYELYQKAHTPFAWHKDLFHVAHHEGIAIFSSVFDFSSVDFLEKLGCPAYKIASFEIVDLPLIEHAASTGKPLIISTGGATDTEILEANEAAGGKAAFLHCPVGYPGLEKTADLRRINKIYGMLGFENPVGISDHTKGDIVPVAATALGATIIEKHLKLDANSKSEDAAFSLVPGEFAHMVKAVELTYEALKDQPHSTANRQFQRSLYAIADIKKGETYSLENIRSIRPGYGLPPKMLEDLLGRKATRDWRKGDPLS